MNSANMSSFYDKYRIKMNKAIRIFNSQAPIELILAIHSYSKIKVSDKNIDFFQWSLLIIRALTQACTYLSNDGFQVKRNQLKVKTEYHFSKLLGQFLLDIVNRLIDAPLMRTNCEWNLLFKNNIDINDIVKQIKSLIYSDGIGKFTFKIKQSSSITARMLSEILTFSQKFHTGIAPFYSKMSSTIYTTKVDTDTGKSTIGISKFCSPVLLPFGVLISGGGASLFPKFFLEIPLVVTEEDSDGSSSDKDEVSPIHYAKSGGGPAPMHYARGNDSALYTIEPNLFVKFQEPSVFEILKSLMTEIPKDTEFLSESFLNGTKYNGKVLPPKIRMYHDLVKKVNKNYSLLGILYQLGLMKICPNGKYQRNV